MRALRFLLISVFCLGYALVFGEFFLRAFAPQPLVPRYVTGGPDGIRANLPDVAFRQWTPEVDVVVRYNDAGMRDDRPAPPIAKRPGECRIAILGDSYFVGFESRFEDSFAAQLERALAAAGTPARVLNFAVSGFGTAEDLVALQRRVPEWHPDLVILSWHASDPVDNIRSGLFRLAADPAGNLAGDRAMPTGNAFLPGVEISDRLMAFAAYRWLIENSHLYSAVRERAGLFTKALLAQMRGGAVESGGPDGFAAGLGDAGFGPAGYDAAALLPERPAGAGDIRLDRALIAQAAAESRAIGAQFLLFDVPIWHSRTEFLSPAAMFLGPLPGIAVASPVADFTAAARPDRKLYWEKGHLHWTAAGNALAAAAAARTIAADALLRGCAAPPKVFASGGAAP